MGKDNSDQTETPVNYLTNLSTPPINEEHMYDLNKNPKSSFGLVKGLESHLVRRKMILRDHPEIAKLLVSNKPWTILIALGVITVAVAVFLWAKDQNIAIWLASAYLISATLNHTLHCCIHDFIHFGGHNNINVNKVMAVLCNIPMGIPSALSFGRYHSDHHNFLGELNGDPDLPLEWEAKLSRSYKWYKYVFYVIISLFYAGRPLFMHKPSLTRDEFLNYVAILSLDGLIYYVWGFWALAYVVFSGLCSIGAHPAAIHIIAEHYEFIPGQQTYDYFGWWNIPNINLGYHIEHHDFPNCPWYNLPKVRAIAPEYYEYLPSHNSYFKVIVKFLRDVNFNLYCRTIRTPPKQQ